MCPAIKSRCKNCSKVLAINNKVGFCLSCLPDDDIIKLFKQGKTVVEISKIIFNSTSGNYRGAIRGGLIKHFGLKYPELRKANKSTSLLDKNYKKFPLDFIKKLHTEGKITTQIHKALLQKGYKLHLATTRNILKYLNLDYCENYKKWLTNRSRSSKKQKELVRDLWMNGESMKGISKATGFAETTVRTYLHSMGFKTKLLQLYYSEPSNKEEISARKYLENNGFEVKKCMFLCQRKLEKPFNEILLDNKFPFPRDLRSFCKSCPIKDLKFEEQEMYDFVIKKENKYSIVEVKKVYFDPYRRAHFSLGQFLNLPKVIKSGIPFKLLIFEEGKIYEREF